MSAVETKTALIALQGMRNASADMAKATERLSTGKRINQAADDPAGNAQAVRLKADIASFDVVKRGLGQVNSGLSQLSDSLNQVSDFLVEMRSLALLTANETSTSQKAVYKESFDQFVSSIKSVLTNTKFADTAVFNGTAAQAKTVQTGINATDTQSLSFSGLAVTGGSLAAAAAINISTTNSSNVGTALAAIDTAIETVSKEVAKVGGYQNSMQFASDYVDSTILNKSIQLSQVMDADYAQEATNLAAARIRQDASTAVLAQANSMTRTVADFLLKGAMG
jgi:flagellin